MEGFVKYVDANRDRFLAELRDLCAQPSIAAQGTGLEETAGLIEQRLRTLGAQVQRFVIDGSPPLLYAELGRGEKTMLVYNHYDVQPPDPLDEWESPPFEPEVRDGRFYARGVADDKGDLLCRLQAIEAHQATLGPLPLRVKFIVEGEEEGGYSFRGRTDPPLRRAVNRSCRASTRKPDHSQEELWAELESRTILCVCASPPWTRQPRGPS